MKMGNTMLIAAYGAIVPPTERKDLHRIELVELTGGTLTLEDLNTIRQSVLSHVTIKTEVPLKIVTTIIEGDDPQPIDHETYDDGVVRAYIIDCILDNCKLPTAHYEDNYIYGKPTALGNREAGK